MATTCFGVGAPPLHLRGLLWKVEEVEEEEEGRGGGDLPFPSYRGVFWDCATCPKDTQTALIPGDTVWNQTGPLALFN